MIINRENKREKRIEIDLTGTDGNAWVLIGRASILAGMLGLDGREIIRKMQSGDYENLIKVFEEYFGDYVILYR